MLNALVDRNTSNNRNIRQEAKILGGRIMTRIKQIADKYAQEILDPLIWMTGEYGTQIIDNRYVAITSNVDGMFDTGVYLVAVKDLKTGKDTGGYYAVDSWKPKFEINGDRLILVDTTIRTEIEWR